MTNYFTYVLKLCRYAERYLTMGRNSPYLRLTCYPILPLNNKVFKKILKKHAVENDTKLNEVLPS